MQKYLVIIIIIILFYYVVKYCIQIEVEDLIKNTPLSVNNNIEKFTDSTNTLNIDEDNAINILAAMARDLQLPTGGLRIQGNLIVDGTFNLLPSGIIVAWNNSIIPSGWLLCDGITKTKDGLPTPDLRGRFILGEGSGTSLTPRVADTIGGVERVALVNTELPAHNHTVPSMLTTKIENSGAGLATATPPACPVCTKAPCPAPVCPTIQGLTATNPLNAVKIENTTTNSSGGTSATVNEALPHENMPPFYVLRYIIKD